jgi:hypothetical protein
VFIFITLASLAFLFSFKKHVSDVEHDRFRSEDLSDHCSHMVRQAVVLTKIGLWYKHMIEARRSELQKAEAKVLLELNFCLTARTRDI